MALLRADALDGLVPMETYWSAIGLDPVEQRRLADEQAKKRGYWQEEY